MKKNLLLLTICLLLIYAAGYLLFHSKRNEIPDLISRNDNTEDSGEFLRTKKAVNHYRAEINKNPDVIKNYVELANIFLQEGRITGKQHEYISKVTLLLEEALRRDPKYFDALVLKSSILMTQHQFKAAKDLISETIKINNYNSAAYGILCDANVELGCYEEAIRACDKMLSIRPDLRSYSRAAYLREIHGDLNGAIEAMLLAANSGVTGAENRAWTLYNLGNLYLQSGKIDTAAFIYNGILQERPDYGYAYAGLANIMLIKENFDKSVEYLSIAKKHLDNHSFTEKLADIYLALGKSEKENRLNEIVLNEFKQHEKYGWNIDREFAEYCMNHNINLNEAFRRAEREYKRRPDNLDALDTYAWALFKTGSYNEAAKKISQALKWNSNNPIRLYRAALIYMQLRKNADAFRKLEESVHHELIQYPAEYKYALLKLNELKQTEPITQNLMHN